MTRCKVIPALQALRLLTGRAEPLSILFQHIHHTLCRMLDLGHQLLEVGHILTLLGGEVVDVVHVIIERRLETEPGEDQRQQHDEI